jgi:hypothetical protein
MFHLRGAHSQGSHCKKRLNAAAGRKSVNSSACAAEPSPAVQPAAPPTTNQQDVQMNVSRGACEANLDAVVNIENVLYRRWMRRFETVIY